MGVSYHKKISDFLCLKISATFLWGAAKKKFSDKGATVKIVKGPMVYFISPLSKTVFNKYFILYNNLLHTFR